MAITKVTQYVEAAPEDTGDWAGHSDHITAYITQMMNQPILLTEWGTTDEPQIAQHVYLAHAGTLYQVDTADFDIATGDLSAAGNYWVKLTTSGDSLAVAWEDDISGFAWNHAYQGLYSGTSQVLPYMVYFDGVDEYTKYRYDLVNEWVIDQQTATDSDVTFATVNTGHGANELYAMDQAVRTTDDVTFATVNTGQGDNELYAMNQAVRTTDSPTFPAVTLSAGKAISVSYVDYGDEVRVYEVTSSTSSNRYLKTPSTAGAKYLILATSRTGGSPTVTTGEIIGPSIDFTGGAINAIYQGALLRIS